MIGFKQVVSESWSPLPSATQLVERKSKFIAFCKSTGKGEANISTLDMIRSVTIPEVNNDIKEAPKLKKRAKKTLRYQMS